MFINLKKKYNELDFNDLKIDIIYVVRIYK